MIFIYNFEELKEIYKKKNIEGYWNFIKNAGKTNWHTISRNPNITWEIIQENPENRGNIYTFIIIIWKKV